jgi:phospholipid transport system transporter-binding protein
VTAAPYYSLETDSLGTLRLRGAISFANAAQAFAAAPQTPKRGAAMDVDLAALEGADSATLAVLIAWSAAARQRGTALRYLRTPQGLRNLAKLADVESLLSLA